MAIDVDTLQKLRTPMEVTPLDLSWLNLNDGHTYGMRAKPGKRGLTLDEIEIGPPGEVPEQSDNRSRARPRLQAPEGRPAHPRLIRRPRRRLLREHPSPLRRGRPAPVVLGHGHPVGRASSRFPTTSSGRCASSAPSSPRSSSSPATRLRQWMPRINSEHHEVKLFLLTQIMDEARHLDVFRKRAFANGGGLLTSLPQDGLRVIIEAKDFTEMSAIMHVAAEGFVQSLFRMGEYIGQNDAEKRIFRMCGQDESRHLGFGVMHLKYVMDNEPWRREEMHHYLDKVEATLTPDPTGDPMSFALFEALAILMGGGIKNIDSGINMSMQVQKKRVNEYMHRLTVAGLGDRRERMVPMLKQFLDN